jgi:hypothetical protein
MGDRARPSPSSPSGRHSDGHLQVSEGRTVEIHRNWEQKKEIMRHIDSKTLFRRNTAVGGIAYQLSRGLGKLALAVAILGFLSFCAVMIGSVVRWGFWPTVAEISYETVGQSSIPEDIAERLDDCLVNAVASQPQGRLRTLLLKDLNNECGYSVTQAWLKIYAGDKGVANALDEVASGQAIGEIAKDAHFAVIIARAQPR